MAWAASTATNLGIAPSSTNPEPISTKPAMTDRRRPKVSANTPVGTSKTKTATSSAVPSNTSRNGSRPTTSILYTDATVAHIVMNNADTPLIQR